MGVASLCAAFYTHELFATLMFSVAFVLTTYSGTVGVIRASRRERKAAFEVELDYTACLQVFAAGAHVLDGERADFEQRFRATVYTYDANKNVLVQCCHYVGGSGSAASRPGREIPASQGIAGYAVRTGHAGPFKVQAAGVRERRIAALVEDFGYTRPEAERLRRDRRSWAAVNIFAANDPDDVAGVLFADSSDKRFFDDDAILELMVWTAKAIAAHVKSKYAES